MDVDDNQDRDRDRAAILALFPYKKHDRAWSPEGNATLGTLGDREVTENDISVLNFGALPAQLVLHCDCRAVVLAYSYKLIGEQRKFSIVSGASLRGKELDPHWAFLLLWQGKWWLVDPTRSEAMPNDACLLLEGGLSVARRLSYLFCFIEEPGDDSQLVIKKELRFLAAEWSLRFCRSLFGPCGLRTFPDDEISPTETGKAQLAVMGRALGTQGDAIPLLELQFAFRDMSWWDEAEFWETTAASAVKKKQGTNAKKVRARLVDREFIDAAEVLTGAKTLFYLAKMLALENGAKKAVPPVDN
jgi:hypothetical protein